MAPLTVRIPADIEQEDKIVAGLTARQVVILAVTGVVLWLGYGMLGDRLPLPVAAGAALVVGTAAGVLAFGIRDGVSADRYLLAAWRHARSPRRQVLAPEGVVAPPAWASEASERAPGPLTLAPPAVHRNGLVELGDDQVALIAEASTVGFALRTPAEQRALVGTFARWLNSLTAPVQILMRSQWVDLRPIAESLAQDAPALPHPALEQAARDHATFLQNLQAGADLLRRQVLLVFVEPSRGHDESSLQIAGDSLRLRVDAARRALAAAQITVTVADGGSAGALIAMAANPLGPLPTSGGWAAPGSSPTFTEATR